MGPGRAGIFGESGSGGLIVDTAISGGDYGLQFGNQQWTFRSVSISNPRKVAVQVRAAQVLLLHELQQLWQQ